MTSFISNQSPYSFANNNPIRYIDEYGLGGCDNCSFLGKIFRAIGDLFTKDDANARAAGNTNRRQSRATGRIVNRNKKRKNNNRPDPAGASTKNASIIAGRNFNQSFLSLPSEGISFSTPDINVADFTISVPEPAVPSFSLNRTSTPIPAGRNISVPTHIQFTGDGTDLAIDGMTSRTLNAIIKTMTDYPQIKLEVYVNYTGVNSLRNDPGFEQRVRNQSNKRGRKIVEFLVKRGVAPSRIRARQGETIFEKRKQNNTRRNSQNFRIINPQR